MKNTKTIRRKENFLITNTETELSPLEFSGILLFLKNIQPHYTDFCVIEGAFRSRTNDKSCIIETGFPYLGKMNFNFGDIKKVANMLSALDKKSRISVKVNDDHVAFADKFQEVQLPIISKVEYLDNTFTSDEEMEDIFFQKVEPDGLLLRESLQKVDIANINKMLRELNSNIIRVTHVRDSLDMACFKISEGNIVNGVKNFQMRLKKPFLLPMKKNNNFDISCIPFEFCKDYITMNFYFTKDENIINIFYNTVVSDLYVNIYARTSLFEDSIEK